MLNRSGGRNFQRYTLIFEAPRYVRMILNVKFRSLQHSLLHYSNIRNRYRVIREKLKLLRFSQVFRISGDFGRHIFALVFLVTMEDSLKNDARPKQIWTTEID